MSTDKEREQARERVRRYREKHKSQTVTPVTASNVTPVTPNKAVCKCRYYRYSDGQLVCSQCGRPAPVKTVEDKLKRGINIK